MNCMNMPNYFLADLPSDATLSPQVIHQACETLKRNRDQYLASRSTRSLIRTISEVAARWLDPESVFRKIAMDLGPSELGFSRETLASGLDLFFNRITAAHLEALIVQDLGHIERLDTLASSEIESRQTRSSIARGPALLAHVAAGNLPNPALLSLILGLLVRSAQFLKCATGSTLLPRLFAHSIYEIEPKLGACLEVAGWKGGCKELERALFSEADCITATGSDDTLSEIRAAVPGQTRFLGYGHRVSFAYVTREMLSTTKAGRVACQAGRDIAAWDQCGCLSPHVLYAEEGGPVSAEEFAGLMANQLEAVEHRQPRGRLDIENAAAIASRRKFYLIRAAYSGGTRVWASPDSTAWTVVYENEPRFQISCLNRFVYVKAVSGLKQALEGADAVRGKVSTVGLAAADDRAPALAKELAQWGVTRVCPMGQMQDPPLTWRHDGRPSLADLLHWTDWEQ